MKFYLADKKDFKRTVDFIKSVDKDFVPPLSERYNIEKDTKKRVRDGLQCLFLRKGRKDLGLITFYKNYKETNSPYIDTLAIASEERGKGLGKIILSECLNKLIDEKDHIVRLRTWSTNQKALSLYKQEGFEIEKVLKNDRGKGVDTIYLEEPLESIRIDIE